MVLVCILIQMINPQFKKAGRKTIKRVVTTAMLEACPVGAKVIPMPHGKWFFVDQIDYERLKDCPFNPVSVGYPASNWIKCPENKGGRVHREIMIEVMGRGGVSDQSVDHINGNILDNRRSNLRLCSHHGNMRNQNKSSGSSKFKGVYRGQTPGTWKAGYSFKSQGMKRSKSHHLGTFQSEVEAALAYDAAITAAFGDFAKTNASLGLID